MPEPRASRIVFALGGNLGDTLETLRTAAAGLAAILEEPRASAVYRTEAEGGADQPRYLNAAVAGTGSLSPRQALALASETEERAGRERPYRGAPRILDVDVVFVGAAVVDEPGLRVPHPRWSQRDFVVMPLMDIVPDFTDPETGRTVRDAAEAAGWGSGTSPRVVLDAGLLLSERKRR